MSNYRQFIDTPGFRPLDRLDTAPFDEWAELVADKRVARSEVDGYTVSTVWVKDGCKR